MDHGAMRRAADAAIVPLVASLAPWGVVEAHWLPDRNGEPVLWVRVGTELQRVTLEAQSWLLPQLHVILARMGMPSEKVMGSRLEVTSVEAETRLFEE
ncbi:hypothetical protein [Nocardioides terrigena]|uniref:hypothetical protein n=1 Tax=Nocardioides terrigena TaxID=424797 RepID=UPI000D2FBA4D|nr:hypothetical protein [Nocardioides terrigena]